MLPTPSNRWRPCAPSILTSFRAFVYSKGRKSPLRAAEYWDVCSVLMKHLEWYLILKEMSIRYLVREKVKVKLATFYFLLMFPFIYFKDKMTNKERTKKIWKYVQSSVLLKVTQSKMATTLWHHNMQSFFFFSHLQYAFPSNSFLSSSYQNSIFFGEKKQRLRD